MSKNPFRADQVPAALAAVLRDLPRLAVAFSGGLDSRFLCHAALLCGCNVLAVHVYGPHIPPQESAGAAAWARERGLRLHTARFDPLALAEVETNSPQRCYGCKTGLVALLRGELAPMAEAYDRVLCDGTNADDLQAYRPGLRALEEGRVRSPLAEAGLTKAQVREAAHVTGLDRPWQRARPCLLTRLAYGMRPEAGTLARLAAAEADLATLGATASAQEESQCVVPEEGSVGALGDFRLRLTPEPVLQAEKLPEELLPELRNILIRHGFWPCGLEAGGNISGFYDAGDSAGRH
ncbi:PP-loop family protein [Desulfovibrio desulfuricans]|uniref:PP-loop family protein n=1 Tax=Desulfovibrio desulfuricans TaxID=876 RepID=UPI001F32431E|nr:PP-loop family protein [Desulfovibrio desulfuricans]UIB00683.1 PP-loop family protein [Desulfovibrio desulfuricans]